MRDITGGAVHDDWTVRVEHAVERMKQDLSRPLLLSELARSAPFSRYHFHRIFGAVTGRTPGRFLAALRMAEARRLLLHSSFAVGVIGPSVGYTSVGTFTTQFTRLVGMAPERFRRVARLAARHRAQAPPGRPGDRGPVICPEHWRPGELLVVGWRAAACGAAVESCLAAGPGPTPVPLPRDGRTYRVRVLLVREAARPTAALVDEASDSYLVGSVEHPLTAGKASTPVPVRLRRPRPIDPPLLSAAPLTWLAESAAERRRCASGLVA